LISKVEIETRLDDQSNRSYYKEEGKYSFVETRRRDRRRYQEAFSQAKA
jgi:hypothetical protein